MADAPHDDDAEDLIELREEVEHEVDELVEQAAEEERARIAARDEQGTDGSGHPSG